MVVRALRRTAVTVVGLGVVGLGIVLLPLPGPGFLVIVAGLAVLATEYVWARRALERSRARARQAAAAATRNRWTTTLTVLCAVAMVGLGLAFVLDAQLPFSSAGTGAGLIVGGVVLLTTTYLQLKQAALLVELEREQVREQREHAGQLGG
jgi:uncharacterized protein (TIGR02611 family)